MPTPQDLRRLQALLKQLTAIGHAQRGELIRAEDWNALVAAVADIARATLSANAAPVLPAHEHPDQVNLQWLAPQLRDLMERGPLSDPAAQTRMTDLDQRLQRLAVRLDEMRGRVDEFRGRLTEVVTRDLEREVAVTTVRRTLDNVIDPRQDLLNMRQTLGSVQRDLGSVLDAAAKMKVNGQTVDIGAMSSRLDQLDQFRERLRFASGELLDAATVESRLAAVENKFVTRDQLTDAIRSHPVSISPADLSGIEERVGNSLRTQVNQVMDTFRGEIRLETSARLDTVGDLINTRLGDALPEVTRNLNTSLSATIETARKSAVESAAATAAQAIAALDKALRADFRALGNDIHAGVSVTVRTEVASQLTGHLDGLRTDLGAVNKKLNETATLTARQDALLSQHTTALAAIPQDQQNLRNSLRESLLGEINLRFQQTTQTIETRLTEFEKTQATRLTALTADLRKLATDAARTIALETAQGQAKDLRTQLLAEMRAVAREEINVSVRDQLKTAVAAEVKEQFTTVPGLIASEVRRVSTGGIVIRPGGGGLAGGGILPGGGILGGGG